MNILLIGNNSENFCNFIAKSNFCKKIYSTSSQLKNFARIEYSSFDDLGVKIQNLQIDIAILFDNNLINQGIVEVLKKYRVNLICTNKKWLNLETNLYATKQLLDYYKINNPKIIKAPTDFPLIIKFKNNPLNFKVDSLQELISIVENLSSKNYFIEEFLIGTQFTALVMWDGKNIWFNNKLCEKLNEVQLERLNVLKTKLLFMFSDEKANFVSFFNINIIWSKNDWYVLNFDMNINENSLLELQKDCLYIINTAIYQKLNEL